MADINRVIRYINGHKRGGENVNKEEFVRFVVDSLREIKERLAKLEERISELEKTKEETDKLKTNKVEVNLSRMNVLLQPAKKGIAMRIRFAKYIKPNNKGEYYVILTENDFNNLKTALNTLEFTTLSGDSENRSVKVETTEEALR